MNKRYFIMFLCTFLFVMAIFANSLTPSDLSNMKSLAVANFLQEIADLMPVNFTISNHMVRKSAHFFEYMILGIFLTCSIGISGGYKRKYIVIAMIAILIPVIDENIQRAVPGRMYSFSDIILDISGASIGFMCVVILRRFYSGLTK